MPYSRSGTATSMKLGRGKSGASTTSLVTTGAMKTYSRGLSLASNASMKSVRGAVMKSATFKRSASTRSALSTRSVNKRAHLKRSLSGKSTISVRSGKSTKSTATRGKGLTRAKSTQSVRSTKSGAAVKFARGRPQSQKEVRKPAATRKAPVPAAIPVMKSMKKAFTQREMVKHRSYKTNTGRSVKKQVHAKEFGGPLRPKSGFSLFSDMHRVTVTEEEKAKAKAAGQPFNVTLVGKILGAMWKEASAQQKQQLTAQCEQQKKEYVVKMEEWKKTPEYKKYCRAQQTHTLHRAKVRIQKKLKAAGLPVKPPTAFLAYSVKMMKIVTPELEQQLGAYPTMKQRAAAIKGRWDMMPEAEKTVWTSEAASARTKYLQDLEVFKRSKVYKKALQDLNIVNRKAGMTLRNNYKGVKGQGAPPQAMKKPVAAASSGAEPGVVAADGLEGEDEDLYEDGALNEEDLLADMEGGDLESEMPHGDEDAGYEGYGDYDEEDVAEGDE